MSGVTDSVYDEINGVRFIDIIMQEMQTEKEDKEIAVGRLAREVIAALDYLWAEKIEYNGISINSISKYIEIFEPPVRGASLAKLLRDADIFYTKLKHEGNKK